MANPEGRGYRHGLLAILGVGLYLRLLVFVDLAAHDPLFALPDGDARMFLDWAARIAAGEGAGEGAFFFNPLYAFLLAPFVKVFGPDPLVPVRFAQAGLGLATVVLTAEAARRFLRDARAGLVAGALAAAWPYLLYAETVVVGIEVSVFLAALSLFALALFAERPGAGRAVAAGAAIGLAALARPNALLVAALLPLWFAAGGRRAAVRWTAFVAAGVLLPLLTVLARNLAVSGEPVLATTSMGANLWLSNGPAARREGRMASAEIPPAAGTMEDAARAAAEKAEGRALSAGEVSSHWTRRTLRAAMDEPGPTARFLARKAAAFLAAEECPSTDFFAAAREEAETLRWIPLGFGILAPFALLGGGLVVLRRREALPLALHFAAYAASLTLFFPLAHYRAPVLPAAFALAALGALSILDAVRARDRAGTLRLAAALAAAALLPALASRALGPMEVPGFRRGLLKSDRLLTRAWFLREEGKPEEADRALDAAERYLGTVAASAAPGEPDRWSLESALANLAAARRRFEEETVHLEAALALSPKDGRLRARLARNLDGRGFRERALAEAKRAAADAPEDPFVQGILAQLGGR
jgi:4-amino-4-deoxy-L-arabinose transferase-like glycosyltransferase